MRILFSLRRRRRRVPHGGLWRRSMGTSGSAPTAKTGVDDGYMPYEEWVVKGYDPDALDVDADVTERLSEAFSRRR